MTAKFLFLSKIAKPEILESVAFLTTIVNGPDKEDDKKYGWVIKYLKGGP